MRRILGAWNNDISLLDMPTHNDLSRRFAILDSEVAHDGLVHDVAVAAPAERVPRLQRNVVLGEQLPQFGLREIWMALDLNEGWNDLAICEKFLDFVLVEIGDSDGAELAFLVRDLKLLIARQVVACGLVQNHEVDVRRVQALERFVDGGVAVVKIGPELSFEKHVFARQV